MYVPGSTGWIVVLSGVTQVPLLTGSPAPVVSGGLVDVVSPGVVDVVSPPPEVPVGVPSRGAPGTGVSRVPVPVGPVRLSPLLQAVSARAASSEVARRRRDMWDSF